jgi:hypothetical protein
MDTFNLEVNAGWVKQEGWPGTRPRVHAWRSASSSGGTVFLPRSQRRGRRKARHYLTRPSVAIRPKSPKPLIFPKPVLTASRGRRQQASRLEPLECRREGSASAGPQSRPDADYLSWPADGLDPYRLAAQVQVVRVVAIVAAKVGDEARRERDRQRLLGELIRGFEEAARK